VTPASGAPKFIVSLPNKGIKLARSTATLYVPSLPDAHLIHPVHVRRRLAPIQCSPQTCLHTVLNMFDLVRCSSLYPNKKNGIPDVVILILNQVSLPRTVIRRGRQSILTPLDKNK
jgi:hypothetical protein